MFNNIKTSIGRSWSIRSESNALPFFRQLGEMLALLATTGLGPGNYHKYRLWQNDMSWEQKKGYWHDQKYYAFLDKVNPLPYRIIARNKIIAKSLMRFYSIPDAQYVAHLTKQAGFDSEGHEFTGTCGLKDLLCRRKDLDVICFKPVEGSGGEGFCAAEIIRSEGMALRSLTGGDPCSVEDFLANKLGDLANTDYIVEEYIRQHPDLAVFNASSLNTLRVWIARTATGDTNIIGMFLRVGRTGSLVDNRLSGGFGLTIDPQDFKTTYAVPQDGGGQLISKHPDSGMDMTGRTLPYREEVIALSSKMMNIIPGVQFAGLDIAFSTNGPIAIEFNLAPSPTGANALMASHESLLGWMLDEAD
jgi:hypothetical protein